MSIYGKMGVKIVINAYGHLTTLGGSRTYPEVVEAMKEATESYVVISELQEAASKVISEATGAEAGLVTSGAFSSLVMASAACMMRVTDLAEWVDAYGFGRTPQETPEWITRIQLLPRFEETAKLPDYEFYQQSNPITQVGLIKDEFIIQRTHRNHYDNAFMVPGGRLVWVGSPVGWDANTELWHPRQISSGELERKITDRTAAVAFVAVRARVPGGLPFEDVVRIAHENGVPVIVDVSGALPPRENLRKYFKMGADLVCFSGGKGIRGPNDTGILAGREDLIKLAHAQSFPYHGTARGYKVCKEQIVGLATALRIYVKQDEKEEFEGWDAKVKYVVEELEGFPNVVNVERVVRRDPTIPYAYITINEKSLGLTTEAVIRKLQLGDPHIYVGQNRFWNVTKIRINPFCLRDGEEKMVIDALKKVLKPNGT